MLPRFSSLPRCARNRPSGGHVRVAIYALCSAALCLCLAAALAGCSTRSEPYGGEVVLSTFGEPAGFNPLLYTDTLSPNIGSLLFNTLVNINEQLEYVPELAESWRVSEDGLSWEFNLRKDVSFHDGEPLDSGDVLFTYRSVLDPEGDSPLASFYAIVESIEAAGSHTVRFRLRKPYSAFPYLMLLEIVPEHLLAGGTSGEDFARNPVGTGPFAFEKWERERVVLAANPEYFEGRPYLDRVIVQWFADQSRAWSALMQGETDTVMDLELEDYRVIENDPRFTVYDYTEVFYHTLLFNLRDPLLSDPRLRLALDLAVDRRDLIEQALNGWAVETTGPFRPGTWPYDPEVPRSVHDPQRAVRILRELGWSDTDGDRILEKGQRELTLSVMVDRGDLLKEAAARRLKWQLFQAGVRVEVEALPPQQLFEERLFAGDFQAVLLQFNAGVDPDKFLTYFWHSENIGSSNLGGYADAEVDRLIEQGRTGTDFEERIRIYRGIHARMAAERPALFLYVRKIYFVTAARIRGINAAPELFYPSIKDWYIDTSQTERR